MDIEALKQAWMAGDTLPLTVAEQFPPEPLEVEKDSGINVLIDLAHECTFLNMWGFPEILRKRGFRACGSQATLDTVLDVGRPVRVRIPVNGHYPFAWWRSPEFNVVITAQHDAVFQDYLPEEQDALAAFVESGGGLVVIGGAVTGDDTRETWPLNQLLSRFGAAFSGRKDSVEGRPAPALNLDASWEVILKGETGEAVQARRVFGQGHIVLLNTMDAQDWDRHLPEVERATKEDALAETVAWAAQGSEPVGGTPLPSGVGGGGAIYPGLEEQIDHLCVYYGKNQKEHILELVRNDFPDVTRRLFAWFPSRIPEEPMFLVMAAGLGGGWAVNACEPNEVGVIALDRVHILGIYAHELAHTMAGPGTKAGHAPHHDKGEAHAGWLQGKILAVYSGDHGPNRQCNRMFEYDKTGTELDLATEYENKALREKWGKGKEWIKMWWVWQKLDDRYGPTWYPRWRWAQYQRWEHKPEHRLTWDDMVEGMSIAVGEDLFPFFRKIGTTLGQERLEKTSFQGEEMRLDIAPIEIGPAGNVRLEPIGDYTKPIVVAPNA